LFLEADLLAIILKLLLSESIAVSLIGGLIGVALGTGAILFVARPGLGLPISMHMTAATALVAMAVAAFVGPVSGLIPSYRPSHLGIVDALRYID